MLSVITHVFNPRILEWEDHCEIKVCLVYVASSRSANAMQTRQIWCYFKQTKDSGQQIHALWFASQLNILNVIKQKKPGFGNYCSNNPVILCDDIKCIIMKDIERSIVSINPGCKQVFKMLCTVGKGTIYKTTSNSHCHNFIAWKLLIPLLIIWLLISHHVFNMEEIYNFACCFGIS